MNSNEEMRRGVVGRVLEKGRCTRHVSPLKKVRVLDSICIEVHCSDGLQLWVWIVLYYVIWDRFFMDFFFFFILLLLLLLLSSFLSLSLLEIHIIASECVSVYIYIYFTYTAMCNIFFLYPFLHCELRKYYFWDRYIEEGDVEWGKEGGW